MMKQLFRAAFLLVVSAAQAQESGPAFPPHMESAKAPEHSVTLKVAVSVEQAHYNVNRSFQKCYGPYMAGAGAIYSAQGIAELTILSQQPFNVAFFEFKADGAETIVRGYVVKPTFGAGFVELIKNVRPMVEQGAAINCEALDWSSWHRRS